MLHSHIQHSFVPSTEVTSLKPLTGSMSHEELPAAPKDRTHLWHICLLANSLYGDDDDDDNDDDDDDDDKNLPGVADDVRRREACEYERSDDRTFQQARLHFHQWCDGWEDNQHVMFFLPWSWGVLPRGASTLHGVQGWTDDRS